jgi:thymidylate synthase ThyX
MYEAKVLADSLSPEGIRVLSVQATFPRFILAEFNTHRVFSRNSASSRAIPTEKLLARVRNTPFVPEAFHQRIKGMGQGQALENQGAARSVWMQARADALTAAQELMEMGVSKSIANRLLEPFMWHTVIVTSTEWDNFFSLRAPVGDEVDYDFPAQPEIQQIAIMTRTAMRASTPRYLDYGEWHLPKVPQAEIDDIGDDVHFSKNPETYWPMVSAGRCAKVSYDRQDEIEETWESFQRAERLDQAGHMSPDEHPCRPYDPDIDEGTDTGNLIGWMQLRKLIPHEWNRIGYLEERPPWDQQ